MKPWFFIPFFLAALLVGSAAHAQCLPGQSCVLVQSFVPAGQPATLSATDVSSSVPLPATGSSFGVLITNAGSVAVNVLLGASSVVVTPTTGTQILAGGSVWLPESTATTLAAITATGTASLTISSGTGSPLLLNGYVQLAPGTQLNGVVTTAPTNFRQTVTESAAALTANAYTVGIVVTALPSNTGTIYVGAAGVTTSTGYPLPPGTSIAYSVANSDQIYIVGTNTSDVIAVTGN